MGGIGSGRHWRFDSKETTDDYRCIDIRRWKREDLLRPGSTFYWKWSNYNTEDASIQVRIDEHCLFLIYRHKERNSQAWIDENYPVQISWSDTNFGGQRPWFICPIQGCGRRVALLYIDNVFACRHCSQLAYESQRENPTDRATRRADKIREKLGWYPGILDGKGDKPKGMHWRTYKHLEEEYDALVTRALAGLDIKLNRLNEPLKHWI